MSTQTRALPEGYVYKASPPPLSDYVNLRIVTGLTPKNAEQGRLALAGAWFTCHIVHESPIGPQVVGMGRVIGDGGWYFHIVDMAVHPDHQKKGLGDFILTKLIEKIEAEAPDNPYINLLADPPGVKLYTRHGFEETSAKGRGTIGMQRWRAS
jgi:GNAT superfamily N-acetyltransferase